MVSRKSQASAQETFENQKKRSRGCDFLKDLEAEPAPVFLAKGYKPSNRVMVVRDFPFPQPRVQTPFSQDLVQPALLSDASEPTQISEHEANESPKEVELQLSSYTYSSVPGNNVILNWLGLSFKDEGIDMPKVVDSMGLIDPSETSEYESMEEVASNFNTPDSTSFETKEQNHNKLSDAQHPLDAQSDSEECWGMRKLKNPENLPLRRSNRLREKALHATEKPVYKSSTTRVTNKRRRKH